MTTKLDIFSILGYLDEGDMEVYTSLREEPELMKELEKNISWLIPQWMTSSTDDYDHRNLILAFNEICNSGWFKLHGHPELQTKLLACCGVGKTRHKYYKSTKTRNLTKMINLLSHKYKDIRDEQVELWIKRTTRTEMINMAESLGYQSEQVADFTKSFDSLREE
jgi:hypothetical protein